jgi:hypothetical protein
MSGVVLPHIAFIGKTGAGKTTAAQIMVERFGYERLSFAAPLKVMLGTTTDRKRLQEFGTEVVRAYEPDAWVNLFLAEVERREAGGTSELGHPRFVVDDCRFPNEAQALAARGFHIIRIAAPLQIRIDRQKRAGRLQDESQLTHISETVLDEYPADHYLVNDGWDDFCLVDDITTYLNRVRA